MTLRTYVIKRILLAIPTFLILLSIVFLILRAAGNPIDAMLGPKAPPSVKKGLMEDYGLNDPLYVQFFRYLKNVLTGDLGQSYQTQRMVWNELWHFLPATLELMLFSFPVAVLLGMFLGMIAAKHLDSKVDMGIRVWGMLTYSLFIPWFGILLQILFSVKLGWFPVAMRGQPPSNIYTGIYVIDALITGEFDVVLDNLHHLALPTITLGIYLSGIFTRLTRNNLAETLRRDFIRAARARGVKKNTVYYKHALKNAFLPILTMISLEFALLLSGAILTESTFSWPGMGRYFAERVQMRDYPAVQGSVVFIAMLIILVSLITDLIYAFIDPRIRY